MVSQITGTLVEFAEAVALLSPEADVADGERRDLGGEGACGRYPFSRRGRRARARSGRCRCDRRRARPRDRGPRGRTRGGRRGVPCAGARVGRGASDARATPRDSRSQDLRGARRGRRSPSFPLQRFRAGRARAAGRSSTRGAGARRRRSGCRRRGAGDTRRRALPDRRRLRRAIGRAFAASSPAPQRGGLRVVRAQPFAIRTALSAPADSARSSARDGDRRRSSRYLRSSALLLGRSRACRFSSPASSPLGAAGGCRERSSAAARASIAEAPRTEASERPPRAAPAFRGAASAVVGRFSRPLCEGCRAAARSLNLPNPCGRTWITI